MSVEVDLSFQDRSEFRAVSRRNDSLGSRGRWTLFAVLCGASLGMGLVFAVLGAWMVLPYSVVEMGVLCWAFGWIERHAGDWERVTVQGDRIVVERNRAGSRTERQLSRFWTRLELDDGARDRNPHLVLRHRGESLRFGEELTAQERAAIARDLRRVLSASNLGRSAG
jgi:uncharacterized membrane protein